MSIIVNNKTSDYIITFAVFHEISFIHIINFLDIKWETFIILRILKYLLPTYYNKLKRFINRNIKQDIEKYKNTLFDIN